jgi:uncharacterized phiE125 gp8 family phage protein
MLVEMTPVPGSDLPLASLAEHMRLSRGFTDDAELEPQIESALRGALAAIEARTGKAVFRRRFVQTVPDWSMAERHVLPIAPVASVDVVRITDRTGAAQVLEPAAYDLVVDTHCPCLVATAVSLPSLGSGRFAEIEFQAGFADHWDGLPADLRQAVLMLAGTFFGQNEEASAGFPSGVSALIEPYRTLRLRGAGA